jgi:ribosomal protein S24E
MEVLKDFKNDLLKRRELKIVIEAEKNPSYEETKKILVDEFKAKEDAIVVNQLKGKFGRKTFLIDASVYDNKEALEVAEPKPKKKEGEGEASSTPAAPAAPATEAPAEEKPAEEAKEEPKAEEKPAEETKEEKTE